MYQIEDPSAFVLWCTSEHRVDRLEDHKHVRRNAEVLVVRVLTEGNESECSIRVLFDYIDIGISECISNCTDQLMIGSESSASAKNKTADQLQASR